MKLLFKFIPTLFLLLFFCLNAKVVKAQEERIIEIQGHSINVFTSGWEHLDKGVPTVIFDGGSTVPIVGWGKVLTEVAENAPVVAFDPPGFGKSEWDGQRPTLETMNERLYSVLEAIGAKPPYVLVGHSWAGWLVRGFAGRYPDKVAGLVLVDPTPSVNEFQTAFREIGLEESGMEEFSEMTIKLMANAPAPYKARQSVIAEFQNKHLDPEVPDTINIPVAFLASGKPADASLPDALQPSFDLNNYFEVLKRHNTLASIELVRKSPGGLFILASDSGHCIHCDDPDLVVWAINRILFPDHNNQ